MGALAVMTLPTVRAIAPLTAPPSQRLRWLLQAIHQMEIRLSEAREEAQRLVWAAAVPHAKEHAA